jgi:hypothetical protein
MTADTPAESATSAEADARRLLQEAGDAIVAGVERELPGYLEARIRRILDAWDGLDASSRRAADDEVAVAVTVACGRVVDELRTLFATDPAQQRSTPLQLVRSAVREPTELLAGLGVLPVQRDEFAERSWPDDNYGLVPHTLDDLGRSDPGSADLGPLHLAWGMAKARVLQARRDA